GLAACIFRISSIAHPLCGGLTSFHYLRKSFDLSGYFNYQTPSHSDCKDTIKFALSALVNQCQAIMKTLLTGMPALQ
ncbi:hypothetical protein, partial [Sutterella wadsworthensis]|uniref:hypothetical protein n=1 Tax=Sutterella wadsworthensis TaxID=40545 RepID=UPI003967B4A7